MRNLLNLKKSIPISIQHRKNPFLSVQTELDRAIDDFYHLFQSPHFPLGSFENLSINPSVDLVEDKENFKVEAEMPGMGEEDIKVSISDGVLTIKGEKSISKKDEGKNYIVREIGYGRYERSIPLPDSVDVDKAQASFKKGMLWVNLPKKAETVKRSREIQVEKIK
jgi:HSP20 family protein